MQGVLFFFRKEGNAPRDGSWSIRQVRCTGGGRSMGLFPAMQAEMLGTRLVAPPVGSGKSREPLV
jgi:sugar (pentulose or hexulose) kinase